MGICIPKANRSKVPAVPRDTFLPRLTFGELCVPSASDFIETVA